MAAADVDMERATRRQAAKRLRAGADEQEEQQAQEGIAQRLAPRRSQQRVLFAEVMAQEREMASLARDKRLGGKDKAPASAAPAKSSKKTRAEARRSQRQALRRAMSPRSPDNRGRDAPLRVGASVLDLGDDDESPKKTKKRRFASNEDAIQDSLLHSTAWRCVKLPAAPANVLPDHEDVPPPFAPAMDRPLAFFDGDLSRKCALPLTEPSMPPITTSSGSIGEARGLAQLEERVAQLVEEVRPVIRKCQSERARAAIANARAQIAAYFADLPSHRQRAMFLTENTPAAQLEVSRLEKVAARKLLRNDDFPVNSADEAPLQFRQGRGDNTHAGRLVLVESVNYLSVIAPTRKSTTCIVTRGTHRVDDDPIMRYVPFFAAGTRDQSKVDISQFEGVAGPRKETLVGCDDEANECILRYVNAQCDGNPAALEVVKRLGFSQQPLADIAEMKRRVLREKLTQDRARRVGAVPSTVDKLMTTHQRSQRQGIRKRLGQPARPFIVNHLCDGEAATLGLRSPSAMAASAVAPGDDALLSASYREFFCRQCFVYNCRNHGTHQPRPVTRVDPRYPNVKAASKLARLAVIEDAASDELPSSSPVSSSSSDSRLDEPMEDAGAVKAESHDEHAVVGTSDAAMADTSNVKNERAEDVDGDSPDDATSMADALQSPQIRRSQRSQTAASTKASTRLLSQRPRERKKAAQPRSRSDPDADVSEYLGLDGAYRLLTANDRAQLLVKEMPCGASCYKNARNTATGAESARHSTTGWQVAEMILLDKLLLTLGDNPCAIARVLSTKSCAEVATCTHRRQPHVGSSDEKAAIAKLIANLRSDYGRERASGVAGNSYDHLRRTRQQRMRDRGANHEYVPCDHAGASCNSAGCSCMRRDHFCDKACSCSRDCANRFPGCRCGPGECRTEACPCFFSLRECDPDVCLSCGACELPVVLASGVVAQELSSGSRKVSVPEGKMCGNVNILRGKFARIAIAPSDTHGWGAFARESIPKGSFIYEYTGSLLSQDEAERRGNVYDKSTVSFLFDLNEDSVVDATRKGNKSKFANHDSKTPKCFARIMFVNGSHRIGIYALEDIAEDDELFFNYGYNGVIPDWSQARIAGEKPVSDAGGNRSASTSRSSSTSSNSPASTAAVPGSTTDAPTEAPTQASTQEVVISDTEDAAPADATEEAVATEL